MASRDAFVRRAAGIVEAVFALHLVSFPDEHAGRPKTGQGPFGHGYTRLTRVVGVNRAVPEIADDFDVTFDVLLEFHTGLPLGEVLRARQHFFGSEVIAQLALLEALYLVGVSNFILLARARKFGQVLRIGPAISVGQAAPATERDVVVIISREAVRRQEHLADIVEV